MGFAVELEDVRRRRDAAAHAAHILERAFDRHSYNSWVNKIVAIGMKHDVELGGGVGGEAGSEMIGFLRRSFLCGNFSTPRPMNLKLWQYKLSFVK